MFTTSKTVKNEANHKTENVPPFDSVFRLGHHWSTTYVAKGAGFERVVTARKSYLVCLSCKYMRTSLNERSGLPALIKSTANFITTLNLIKIRKLENLEKKINQLLSDTRRQKQVNSLFPVSQRFERNRSATV